ncbi:helix-turn-helix transcriptional regulator [Saccharopolyspora oryzae]|uniref:Helix-turn-helix transcriptional regulator n=1 Tax=Saccharopolyspora oryzae TaxID=2997343 RepID=A0ABT4V788_9PSEU|nr:helix-turn-helix transcriptional regulator [Saccharopolyspora oryzae]MDA3629833.1 helix-turn-helix transcriptional regulator [Saccharopolyspora oryzae]
MTATQVGAAVDRAREAAGLSQRGLADRTGISQTTLSRIISGERAAKMPEIIRIADATGYTVAQLTGTAAAERVQCAARASNGSGMEKMRQRLLDFIELDAYLDEQAVTAPQ